MSKQRTYPQLAQQGFKFMCVFVHSAAVDPQIGARLVSRELDFFSRLVSHFLLGKPAVCPVQQADKHISLDTHTHSWL